MVQPIVEVYVGFVGTDVVSLETLTGSLEPAIVSALAVVGIAGIDPSQVDLFYEEGLFPSWCKEQVSACCVRVVVTGGNHSVNISGKMQQIITDGICHLVGHDTVVRSLFEYHSRAPNFLDVYRKT